MPNKIQDHKKIAERIELIRQQRKLTQQQLAGELGISQSAISKYLSERIPAPDVLLKLAGLGKTTIEWILTGEKSYFFEDSPSAVRERDGTFYDAERALAREIAGLPVDVRKAIHVLIGHVKERNGSGQP
jgi:transcriptional regulator with XRE-family HTH domain